MPRCSVVIPAYNVERYAGDAIRSALHQTYRDFEIIVVDDGSTDQTAAVVESFGDRVIHITQPNRGSAAARNAGIRRASGELIALLDADDQWLPRRLGQMVEYLDQHPSIGFATSDAYLRYEETPSTSTYYGDLVPCQELPPNQPYWIVQHNFVFTMVVIRRYLFDRHGDFDESVVAVEDWDLWIRFILGGDRLGLLHTPLAYYRIRQAGLTRSDPERWTRHASVVASRALKHTGARGIPGIGRDLQLPAARHALKAGRMEEMSTLFRAASRDPVLPSKTRAKARAAALSPRLAGRLWPEPPSFRKAPQSLIDEKNRVYRFMPRGVDGVHEATHPEGGVVVVSGWATDLDHGEPADAVVVFAGGEFVATGRVDFLRPDVVSHFGNPRLAKCGFRILVADDPARSPESLDVVAVSRHLAGALPKLSDLQALGNGAVSGSSGQGARHTAAANCWGCPRTP